jgi:hypothetical protein
VRTKSTKLVQIIHPVSETLWFIVVYTQSRNLTLFSHMQFISLYPVSLRLFQHYPYTLLLYVCFNIILIPYFFTFVSTLSLYPISLRLFQHNPSKTYFPKWGLPFGNRNWKWLYVFSWVPFPSPKENLLRFCEDPLFCTDLELTVTVWTLYKSC